MLFNVILRQSLKISAEVLGTNINPIDAKYLWLPNGSVVKNMPEMEERQETQVWSLVQEDHFQEEMATHSSTLA